MFTKLTIYKKIDISDIPEYPKTADIWVLDAIHALWFTTLDNRWRFMNLAAKHTLRSNESFTSKNEAMKFYNESAKFTWTRTPLTVEVKK